MKRLLIGFICALFALVAGEAKETEALDIWVMRQDFVKFGKKEVYEAGKKQYFYDLSQFTRKRSLFSSYALQALESPQYLYLSPVGSYGGIDRLIKQHESFQSAFNPQDWDTQVAIEASTINFFFNKLQRYLPSLSSIPRGKEDFFSLPYVYLYWIQIAPGQSGPFEDHLAQLVQAEMKKKPPSCWRVWRGTFGDALPEYFIMVFAATEKESEEAANQMDFISGSVKQIVRKLRQDRAVLRPDLSLKGLAASA